MIYSTKELLKIYKNYPTILRLSNSGKIFKIAYGVYSDKSNDDSDLEVIFSTYRNIILTNESAYLFYNISEFIPEKYSIVSDIKAAQIKFHNVNQSYMKKELLNIGRRKVKTENGFIYIYDKERLLIEIVRLRSKFTYEYFKEVIGNYRKLVDNNEINFVKVVDYCNKFKNGLNIRKKIEDLIL